MPFQKGNKLSYLRKSVGGPFKKGHKLNLGRHLSPETEFKKGHNSLSGEEHPNWQGNRVSYSGIHDYIKYHFPKPQRCQNCGKEIKLDLANISGDYKRDISDWMWICRKCHVNRDNNTGKAWVTRRGVVELR